MSEVKSELSILLKKNAYGSGLTDEEYEKALGLISSAEPTDKDGDCWVCGTDGKNNKAIHNTSLCASHSRCALATRK